MDKIYLLIGNDTPLAVCLRKSEGEETPVPYDLSEARHLRLTLVGHGMRVCAKDIEVSGDDNNVVSGMIPGRSLLKGDYDLEVTFNLDGRDKRFAIDDMFEAVDFLAEDADGEAEGEGAGIHVTVTVQPELIEISGPAGPQGKSAYQVWLDDGHTGTEDDFFEWLAAQTPNPDWNQNDSTKADFIKNRTHYEETATASLEWDTDVADTSRKLYLNLGGNRVTLNPYIGLFGLLYWRDVENNWEWQVTVGDTLELWEQEDGENVRHEQYDGFAFATTPQPFNLGFGEETTVHKLDNKYLDLDSTPTLNSQKPVTSDGVKRALNALPTVPVISTNVETDGTSDSKTSSPKSVKTFVEGKGYYTKPQSGIPASDIAAGVIPTVPTDIVKYTSQSLTDAQKEQARTNIGAASDSEVSQLRSEVEEIYDTTEVADKFTFGGVSNVITFNPISIAEDGDALEFRAKCALSVSAVSGYGFIRNGETKISISLTRALLGIKSASNSWISDFDASNGKYEFGAIIGNIATAFKTFKLIRESTSLKLYIDGTLYKEVANAPTITFDRIGGAHSGNYWSGELEFFHYIHNGVTTELLDFPGYSVSGDVVVTTHTEESGLLSEKVDKIPGKGLSTNDFTDEEKAELNVVANASALTMTDDFIGLLEDRALNDSGEELELPIVGGSGYGKFIGVSGKIYTGAANFVRLLLTPGSVTYNGVTLSVDEDGWVTMTGTATGGGVISYTNLKGYAGADTAKADVVIPEMPSGTYKLAIAQCGTSSKATIYVRAKNTNSWILTLTPTNPNGDVVVTDVGAFVAYLISGRTYNEHFRFMIMPMAIRNAVPNIQSFLQDPWPTDIELIDKDGIYRINYTLGDGTVTKIEQLMPSLPYATKGVRCAWFGDSISALKQLPHLTGDKMAIVVHDCSFAGAPLAESTPAYTDTGFCSLASQIVDGDFSPAQTAINLQYTSGFIDATQRDAKLAQLASLAALDFTEIDKIVILSGTNDLSVSAATVAGIKSSFTSALTTILTAYPQLQIYFVLPPYRTDAYEVHPNGLTLPDINNGIKEVCETFGIPCFDFLHNCGVNAVNYTRWLPDGLHPSDYGDEMFSTRIANWLKSIF